MIDPSTGTVVLESLGLVISPELSKPDFLWSKAGRQPRVLVSNPPHCSYVLPRTVHAGRPYIVSLWFKEDRLESVALTDVSPEFGGAWSDMSEQNEKARHAAHGVLMQQLFPANPSRDFGWGSVRSVLDPKSGGASIWIRYMEPKGTA